MAWANPNKPAGLSPVFHLQGLNWISTVHYYAIAAADTNAYYPGDVVKLTAGGDSATGLPGITLGTAGATAVGVVAAVGQGAGSFPAGFGGPPINPNNLTVTSRPAAAQSGPWYAAVIDDPYVVFEVQEGGTGTTLTYSSIGLNVNFKYNAPATGVYVSGTVLDDTTAPTTTSTLNLFIYSLAQRIDNHFVSGGTGGNYQKWWVLLNNHQYKTGITAP